MTRSTGSRCSVVLIFVAGLGLATTARADVRTEARQHFRAGMRAVQEGNFETGIPELLTAYDLLPHPNVLYNIAQAYQGAGNYEESIAYFERYLESDPPDREEVNGFLRALRARLEARQAREQPAGQGEPTVTETPGSGEPATPTETTEPIASEDEIQAIEDSAQQILTLAEATQSDSLRQRAARLRALAATLRTRRAAPRETTAGAEQAGRDGQNGGTGENRQNGGTGENGGSGGAGAEPAGPGEQLGETRGEDVYAESVVSASRTAQSPLDAPNSTTIITAQDIRLSGLTSLADLLRRAAGVDVMRLTPGDTQFSIRGLNQRLSNKVIVLIDGRSVYLDFLGVTQNEMLPVNLEDVERIEVIRGPASALYGADAVTGIVNIITRPPGEGRSYVSLGAGNGSVARATAGVTGRAGAFAYSMSAGYLQAYNYTTDVQLGRADVQPLTGSPYGMQSAWFDGDLRYNLGDGYVLRGGNATETGSLVLQGLSRLRQIETGPQVFSQTYAQLNTPFGLQLRTFWNGFTTNAAANEQIPGSIPVVARNIVQHVIDAEATYANNFDIGFRNDVTAGLAYRFKYIDWVWLGPQINTQNHFAAFLQDQMRIFRELQVVLSARVDVHPLLAEPQFSPRASIVVRPTEGQAIRATVGRAFRGPTFVESYLNLANPAPLRGVTAVGAGNQRLRPEEIISAEVGYANQESDFFALEVNGYFNFVNDLISLSSIDTYRLRDTDGAGASQGGAIPPGGFVSNVDAFPVGVLQYQNLGVLGGSGSGAQFRQIGAEVGVRVFPIEGLDLYANYAISETAPNNLAAGEIQQRLRGFQADQRTSLHKVNAGVQYRSSFGLDLSVDFHWVSSQLWVEQVSDVVQGVAFQAYGQSDYSIVDARIGYRITNQIEVGIVGTNLVTAGVRQHPFGQPIDRRIWGNVTVRW